MYLYAYTVRQINPNGVIETVCGSWSRDEPISTLDEFTKTAKEIGASCGFDNGVIESFSLIYSPDITKPAKTIEQHRSDFQEWYTSFKNLPKDADLTQYDECFHLWKAWKAARGVTAQEEKAQAAQGPQEQESGNAGAEDNQSE